MSFDFPYHRTPIEASLQNSITAAEKYHHRRDETDERGSSDEP